MNVPRLRVSRRLPGSLDRVTVFSGAGGELPTEPLAPGTASTLRELARGPGWSGRLGQRFERLSAGGTVVELAGLGALPDLEEAKLRAEIAAAVERAGRAGARRLGIVLPAIGDGEGPTAEPIARAAALAEYRFERFRQPAGDAGSLEEILFVPAAHAGTAWRDGVRTAAAVAGAVAWTRDLANSPPNEATPAWIAARARDLARRTGARATVLGPAEMRRRGMGGILAVGGGSAHPPRMVRLAWGSQGPKVALVGKGVTFDSGGISIKPAAAMDEMKWDKCGACTVLGVLHAAAALELRVRLRLYLPLAENMLGAAAYRPGDIVRCANGKTVEILNTDAEGRLIVADALSWATAEKPDALLELSTLTGACVVALGQGAAGLFTPDDGLAGSLLAAAEASGERLWRLPLWPEFVEEMKGAHADLRNVAGRWGGASTAAAFLSQFMGGVARWAHLDIAGPAYVGGEDRARRGATGYGVATVVRWLSGIGREGASRRAR
jgi:leucyl aminopeptidase